MLTAVRSIWGKWACLIGYLAFLTIATLVTISADKVYAEAGERSSEASAEQNQGRMLLIAVPGLSFQEWNEAELSRYPHLRQLVREGATGAMNIRTPVRGVEDVYASIGLGAPMEAGASLQAYHVQEWVQFGKEQGFAGELLARRTGLAMSELEVVVPDIVDWPALQNDTAHRLGDMLLQAGVPVYAFGNRDRGWPDQLAPDAAKLGRHAPLLLINRDGAASGDVSARTNALDPGRPFGLRTNYEALLHQLQHLPSPSLALVELGDLDRLYDARSLYQTEQFHMLKHTILQEMDAFVGQLINRNGSGAQYPFLLLFSPSVHADAYRSYNRMAPITLWRPDNGSGGSALLTSATTRRAAVVSMYDIAPTLLAELHLQKPPTMIGAVMHAQPKENALEEAAQTVELMRKIYELRPPLLYSFVSYEITVLLGLLVIVVFPSAWRARMPAWLWQTVGGALLLSLLAAPVVLLVMGWAAHLPGEGLGALFVTGTAALAVAAVMTGNLGRASGKQNVQNCSGSVQAAGWLGAAGAAAILLDGLTGAEAMKHSVLGYDAMVGARYYGIGNEFMGVLVGSALLATAAAAQYWAPARGRRRSVLAVLSLAAFLIILFYLAAPSGGTNAGGALTAATAFAILYTRLFTRLWEGKRAMVRLIGIAAAAGLSGLLLLWGLNAWLPMDAASQSHIGKAMELVEGGRLDLIAAMVYRKLSMNVHLIGVSSWSKVLIASLLVMIVLLIKPRGVFHRWQHAVPDLMHGFIAIVAGAVTALLVNDSGIVSAATMIVYVAVPMLLLRLHELSASNQEKASDYSAKASHSS
ncbi:hypothetical protein DUZ99_02360 [Xylanibacillus composti]|uniref:Uncharacterized protein n=1 Tax=Xylanibacillus composti TaxID=1572762 RepID=A0A8J4GY80_9BACL|nr:hypothetical protein [Xylanibacillus composti]MDT9723839.1 hypothetical protein [Xylanibacillus composti]GIQ67382.1 hypothetical protein XYCOK13_02060 [Xylanibacillus composti]